MTLITEKFLRSLHAEQKLPKEFLLQVGDKLTPSAKDFLVDRKIPIRSSSRLQKEEQSQVLIAVGVSNRPDLLTDDSVKVIGKNRCLFSPFLGVEPDE